MQIERKRVLAIVFSLLAVLLVGGGLAGVKTLQIRKLIAAGQAFETPPESVSSVVVREEKWQDSLIAIGSISAVQGVTLTPDLPGAVREIAFESGMAVKQGDLLLRLDTSSEEAQLRAVEAQVELASINLTRVRRLSQDRMIPESELDAAEATRKESQASADTIRAAIAKKTIRAPFAGRLGIRLVHLGQYLDAGKPIVSLQALEPVYVDFSLPQQELAHVQVGMPVRVTTDAYPGRVFEGRLSAINPELDASTRSVSLQATLANADEVLRPGMFVRAEVLLPDAQTVLVIPATAVLSAPYGDSVYVIEPKPGKDGAPGWVVRQQFVRTTQARGDYLAVASGLKPDQRIVSSGVFKLRNGMSVVENNELAPQAAEAPQPSDG